MVSRCCNGSVVMVDTVEVCYYHCALCRRPCELREHKTRELPKETDLPGEGKD